MKQYIDFKKIDSNPRFHVKPRHWWKWLFPSFWRQKKLIEQLAADFHEENEKDIQKFYSDLLLFGNAKFEIKKPRK